MAVYLPDEERLELIEAIQKMTTEKSKRAIHKRWSNTLPPTSKTILYPNKKTEDLQRYTPKTDGVNQWHSNNLLLKNFDKDNTLIGSCRIARIKEDNNNGLFEIQERFNRARSLNKFM